jgi:Fe2+ or Zn2+ uptake regulation protein
MAKQTRETRQKQLLQEELNSYTSFFTGKELFEKAHEKDKNIGLATVYRFLKDLRERGMLHAYTCNRRILYSQEKKSHCHFICERCKKVRHFYLDKIDFVRNGIEGDICHFQLDVHGICKECKKRTRS